MAPNSLETSDKVLPLTKANGVVINTPRALWIGTSGTLTFVDVYGNTVTDFPAQVGLNPVRPKIISEGGTADDIWGLY